jgi:hypothetical protein
MIEASITDIYALLGEQYARARLLEAEVERLRDLLEAEQNAEPVPDTVWGATS